MNRSLDQLKPGESGLIEAITGDPGVTQRLLELGLFEGETVRVIGTAPLGDPIEITVCQSRLSLRRSEAAAVLLRPS